MDRELLGGLEEFLRRSEPNFWDEIPYGSVALFYMVLSIAFNEIEPEAVQEFQDAFRNSADSLGKNASKDFGEEAQVAFRELADLVLLVLSDLES